ncbi:hypothetical protein DOS86_04290 [Anaplasma marginale]|uniref:AsmA-like C-terminal region-containing protein n=1 Tax=Anaplasma marginale TaxID=770 RepID=UPI000DEF5B97|nr:AsmA-like C-terminal region-containing protein [Anaplasma marginale]RCL19485.1 hypothetical protein DOS86_04290 [Anaplasma marginale]
MGDAFGIPMKFLGRLCCCVLVVFAALAFVPYLVDWNAHYGEYVFKQLGAATGSSGAVVKAIGNIEGSLLLPKLTVRNLYVECSEDAAGCAGTLSIDRMELSVDPLSILMGEPKVRTISLYGLRTSVGGLVGMVGSQTKSGLGHVRIFDSAVVTGGVVGASASAYNTVHVKSATIKSSGSALFGDAVLKIGGTKYLLSSKLERSAAGSTVKVELHSPNTSMVLSGNGAGQGLFDDFGARFEVKTENLSELAQTVAVVTNYRLLGSVASAEEMVLSAGIKAAKGSGFEVKDLTMQSKSISGTLELACTYAPFCTTSLNFSSIDLDALFPEGLGTEQDAYYADFQSSAERFSVVPSWLDATVGLDVREINYRGGVSRNLVAAVSVRQGRIAVDRLLLDLPGKNNRLSVSGVTSEDAGSIVPRFVGTLSAQGDDADTIVSWLLPLRADAHRAQGKKFALTGSLYVAPRIFSLLGARMYAGGAHAYGNVKYKYGKRGGEVIGDVTMSNFSVGGYSFDEDFDVKRDVMDFTWLRSVSCPVKLAVRLQNFAVNSGFVKELSFLADLSQHKVSVEKISMRAVDEHDSPSDLEGRASVALSSRGMRPKVFVSLKSARYSDAFLRLPKFVERTGADVPVDTTSSSPRGEKSEKFLWSSKPIDLASFEGLDGSIEVHVKELFFGGRMLSNFTWLSTLKEGVMSMDKLHFAQGKSGTVDISGNIGMGEVSSLSLVVSASDVSIGDVEQQTNSSQTSKVSGHVSVSGSIQTQGRSMLELANALKGKIKFAARGLDIGGVDLNGFIEDLFAAESKSEVASLARVHLYRGSTLFETLDGESQIDQGSLASSLQFKIGNAAGSASVNLSVPQLAVIALFRFFFIPPESESPVHMDMHLQGYVWQPNPTFDIDSLYEIVRSNR